MLGTIYKTEPDRFAEIVLDAIEESGMLPPLAKNPNPTGGCLCTLRESCYNCGGGNEWEPEDG